MRGIEKDVGWVLYRGKEEERRRIMGKIIMSIIYCRDLLQCCPIIDMFGIKINYGNHVTFVMKMKSHGHMYVCISISIDFFFIKIIQKYIYSKFG